jgi:hypothetical protein
MTTSDFVKILPTIEFWETFKKIDGALSCTEALAIMNIAVQAPNGWAIELGTHKGKSAMSAMAGLKDCFFLLVDPIFEDEKIYEKMLKDIEWVNETVRLKVSPLYSTDVMPNFAPYAYVFVDSGSHQDGLPMQEVKMLEDNVMQGGIIAFHDFQSQFVEVEEAYNYLIGTGKYDKIEIDWDKIVEYINKYDLEANNKSWHHNELRNPCFVGALRRR